VAFTDSVYDTLYSMDRLASAHDVRFAAQDDDWILLHLRQKAEALPAFAEIVEPQLFCSCYPSVEKDDAATTTDIRRAGDEMLHDLLNKVDFRMKLMSVATSILEIVRILLPDQLTCHEFD
jgi:hypothetical protein